MKVFSSEYLTDLSTLAVGKARKRQHQNIHYSYADLCQRLFNAIEPKSYIRPHMHGSDPKDELLIAVRGLMALVIFDDKGQVTGIVRFAASRSDEGLAVGVEVPANTWHTVVSLEVGSILLEVKEGPFDPEKPKDLAPWAPDENGPEAKHYLEKLTSRIIG
jgi:cupin fold WbuC family metalloprotein